MILVHIAAVTSAILNAFLGLFVLSRAPKGRVQQAFACFALSGSIWIGGIVASITAPTHAMAFRCSFIVFIGSNLLAACMARLAGVFPGESRFPAGKALRLFAAFGVGLAFLSPTGCYVSHLTRHTWGWEPVPGPMYPLASFYFCLSTLYSMASIISRWRRNRGLERLQVQYLMMGIGLSLLIGIPTNLILPIFHETRYQEVGPAGALLFVLCAGYSIAKFRLLDISWVIMRGIAYGISVGTLALVYMLAVVVADSLVNRYLGYGSIKVQAVLAMVIAMIFNPIYRFVQKTVNILFFRQSYDYPKTLRSVSRGMTSVLDLQQLREHLSGSVTQFMQVESASLAIWRGGEWEMDRGSGPAPTFFPSLLSAMTAGRICLREEAAQEEGDAVSQQVAANMEQLGIDVAVPLLFKDELVAILLVGPKRSGTVFTDQDIALLSTLANQAAIAIRNAQLYLAVRTSHQYTQAILERLDSAVLTVGIDARPIVVNEAARRLLPRRDGEIVLPPIVRSAVSRVFRSAQEQADLEFDLIGPDSNPIPVVAMICPFIPEIGTVDSALIVIRDISVLRRLEDERVRADRFSSISRVAATLAHEIRNPLASIKTFFDLLPEKYLDVEFRENFAQIASQEVERINSLVSNLLAADKSAKGAWEPVDLAELISTTVQLVEPMMLDKGVRLNRICQDNVPTIMGDKGQLRQLLLNLLLNAEQASPPKSPIIIRLFCRANEEVVCEVINHGTPIPASNIPRLFDPFFTTRSQGTGLGLTVCKQVADYHKGTITAESSEEAGTVFRVSLPPVGVAV